MADYQYVNKKVNGKRISYLKHRAIWEDAHGEIPFGFVVHHKNNNGWDNRIENLELVSRGAHTKLHPKGSGKNNIQKLMIISLMFVFLFTMNLAMVSAYDFDNVKSYDVTEQEYTIKNGFGIDWLGGETLAKVKLITPIHRKVNDNGVGIYQEVARLELSNWKSIPNALGEIKTYNYNNLNSEINRDIKMKYLVEETEIVDKIGVVCDETLDKNGTTREDNCLYEVVGKKAKVTETWIEFSTIEELPKQDEHTIGLYADVVVGERIEWIPDKWYGERLTAFADWSSDLILAHNDTANLKSGCAGWSGTVSCDGTGMVISGGDTSSKEFADAGNMSEIWVKGIMPSPSFINSFSYRGSSSVTANILNVDQNNWNCNSVAQGDLNEDGSDMYWIAQAEGTSIRMWYDKTAFANIDTGAAPQCSTTNTEEQSNDYLRMYAHASYNKIRYTNLLIYSYAPEYRVASATLSAPAEGVSQIDNTIDLLANFTGNDWNNISVVTYLVYDSADNLDYSNTETGIESTANNQSYNDTHTTGSLTADTYKWAAFMEGDGGMNASTANRTFNIVNFVENSISYTTPIMQGTTDTFTLNMSAYGVESLTATLFYNNVSQVTGKFGSDSEMRFVSTVAANKVGTVPIFWEINYGGVLSNSTFTNQNVTALNFSSCLAGETIVYNFTIFDEDTQVKLPDATTNLTFEVFLNATTLSDVQITTYNATVLNTNPIAICTPTLLGATPIILDGIVRYEANGTYISEFYTIQNYSLTNITANQNISLYDLFTPRAQEFKVTFKDASFLPVAGTVLDVQRNYIGDGVYRTVEKPPFDNDGETLANLVLGDVIYTLIVKKDNQILATFDNIKAFCNNAGTGDCEINLNAVSSFVSPDSYATVDNTAITMSYDETTRTVSTTFSTTDGTTKVMLMNVTTFDLLGNESVCSDGLTASSGTISCVIPGTFGNSTAKASLYIDGTPQAYKMIRLWSSGDVLYGYSTVTLQIFSFLTVVGLALGSSPIVIILSIMLGLVINIGLLLTGGTFVGIGSSFLWVAVVLLTLIWKANRRQS